MTSGANLTDVRQCPLTVHITPSNARFAFNIHATRWFTERAITRISIRVDPVLRSATVSAAVPSTRSLALDFRCHRPQDPPVQAAFKSRQLISALGYANESRATFLITASADALTFLADPEYALRSPVQLA